ncbi:UDP-N-acetylmuramoyl-tripeptide--D-alanyl-D-alanine ligase [Pendulispora brunnea]|uniref:UDP-N-acetylmuramoyl-tripeptide--D-alanyl-D-alanine ligase n=1 Tax=Pendulispora brunnea TaxID=2905690 RepID=A0ABZ2K174_9BACT
MSTPIPKNRVQRTSGEIARITGGTLVRGKPERLHTGLTTNSREATPGCVFVALRGENFDGHAFVLAAARAGASLMLIERGRSHDLPADPESDPEDCAPHVVEVDDTLVAWGALARDHLARWRAKTPQGRVVAITGSAGKTTTKSFASALLAEVDATHATLGNLNNRVGVPAMIFALEPHHRFVVLEMGTNMPGEIATLASIAVPDAAIITNIGLAHAERLGGTRAGVGVEKGSLFAALPESGCAVVNADDDEIARQLPRTVARHTVSFGRASGAAYRLLSRAGNKVVFSRAKSEITLDLPLAGEAAAVDFLAALAATEFAIDRALSLEELARGLARVALPEGRAQIHTLSWGITVIDDSYNANPSSMSAAIELAVELAAPSKRRIVAVLGEMRELGPAEAEAHAALGDELARARVDTVIGCGGSAIWTTLSQAARGGVRTIPAETTSEAADAACAEVRPGDVVLVKGSRGVQTERVAIALLARDSSRTSSPQRTPR